MIGSIFNVNLLFLNFYFYINLINFFSQVASSKLTPMTDELNLSNISVEDINKREEILSKYRQYCDAKNAAVEFQRAKDQVRSSNS